MRMVTGGGGSGGGGVTQTYLPIFYSAQLDFLSTGTFACALPFPIQNSFSFWLQQIGIICNGRTGAIVTQPTICFGRTGNTQYYKTPTLMTLLTGADTREVYEVFDADGPMITAVAPSFQITVAATGPTVYTGYVYYSGVLIPQ